MRLWSIPVLLLSALPVCASESAHDAEDAHENGADADRDAEPVGVDEPRNGDGERHKGDHEGHGEVADLQVGDAVEFCGGTCDGRIGDPQGLDGQVDEGKGCQHHPAVGVEFVL